MRIVYNMLCLVVLISCLSACKKDLILPEKEPKFRTVMVYLAANNSLIDAAYKNINQMEEAIGDVDGDLIVYARLQGVKPALYRILPDKSSEIRSRIVKEYAPHNSSDPAVMKQVLDDIQSLYPAQTYGLILWSHATGWIPPVQGGVKVKSFGDDNGNVMDIKDFGHALPDDLDFILFDACSMASVEVLYEIKDKASYFISSPGEVIANGMPYGMITNDFFQHGVKPYQVIAQKYYDHYNRQSNLMRSATVSVIDSRQLMGLAIESKQLLSQFKSPYPNLKRNEIQRMDFDRSGNPLIAFDYKDFLVSNFGTNNTARVIQQLSKVVMFKANTPSFNNLEIKHNGGITCYIPTSENEGVLHDYYRTLAWYKASGFDLLF